MSSTTMRVGGYFAVGWFIHGAVRSISSPGGGSNVNSFKAISVRCTLMAVP